MQVDPTPPLASLVNQAPDASRVLLRHDLDFCCGGQRSLTEACERLTSLTETVHALGRDLRSHVQKEETILFPWILGQKSPALEQPIAVMRADHEQAGALLERIVQLTDAFTPPAGACATWRNLYDRLERFVRELRQPVHLENNVLFPRALLA